MLNKLVLRALLSLSLAFSFAGGANAALITQDILDGEGSNIGFISINTNNLDEFDSVLSWETFNILGFDMLAPDAIDNEFGDQFYASVDPTDFSAGIFDMFFDVTDIFGAYQWEGAILIEDGVVVPDLSYGIVVNELGLDNPPVAAFVPSFTFGEATVVPTPATLVLFLTAVAGLVARRKTH
jgi:hypothetical protein